MPDPIRSRLSVQPDDPLDANIEPGCIVSVPVNDNARIASDPVTGLPVLTLGAEAPILSSREVEEILNDLPA